MYDKNNPESIKSLFGSIAKQYDRTNAIISFNMHRFWNFCLVKSVLSGKEPKRYLDLCCGTGEIALPFLNKQKTSWETHLLDFCPEMLEVAKLRAEKLKVNHHNISYHQADAQEIPLKDASIDRITMAYGIRNIPNPDKCFKDIYRVLDKGGQVAILELTKPKNSVLRVAHSFYLTACLPIIGKLATSNKEAYQYLCDSVKSFTEPELLEYKLKNIGFKKTTIIPLIGGIATIIRAEK